MGTSLYFPDGVPESLQRILDPDAIHKEVIKGLGELEEGWSQTAERALSIVQGKRGWWKRLTDGGGYDIDPQWLVHILNGTARVWPKNLSKNERELIHLLKTTYPLAGYAQGAMAPEGERPDDGVVLRAFRLMAKDTRSLVAPALFKTYMEMLKRVALRIEDGCYVGSVDTGTSGEECGEDWDEIIHADIDAALRMSKIHGMSKNGSRLLREFMRYAFI